MPQQGPGPACTALARRYHTDSRLAPGRQDLNWLSVTIALLATAVCARTLIEARNLRWQEHLRAALHFAADREAMIKMISA